ncbi:MAG: lipoyl synthase [Desulfobacterales bacterium]
MNPKSPQPPSSRKPAWLRRRMPSGSAFGEVRRMLESGSLHTVCQEARCPNQGECFSSRTATFLILGPRCTRACRFCAVEHGPAGPADPDEPARVAGVAREMGLRYVVITSVTRDDLPDGGASAFAATIRSVRDALPDAAVEVLIPDFAGDRDALMTVVEASPDVLNHNLETVRRLYAVVRPGADYDRSLSLLKTVRGAAPAMLTKSGLMLGLGETESEVRAAMEDLLSAGCRMLTLGQYLQPTKDHLPVTRYVTPEEFDRWAETARSLGFAEVAAGPLVRSSYRAGELYQTCHCSSESA